MLQLPDFKEKQIVIIRGESGEKMPEIRFKNENIALLRDGKIVNQVSCHSVFALFIVGDTTITTTLLRKALSLGVSIFLMKPNLDTYAGIGAMAEGNYILKQKQHLIKNNLHTQLTR